MTKVKSDFRIGVISDTHGLLRPAVQSLLKGVDHVLHAGDIGDQSILDRLADIAPVTAIRGNIDVSGPCSLLPETEMVDLGGITIYLVHSLADLDIQPKAAEVDLVVSGHSHTYAFERHDDAIYLNPGSVGPRRFKLPVTMAYLHLTDTGIEVERIEVPA